ncbi:peptide/nickel transport system substrate-binding protein [Paenibacillus phyllosphaerae]|uniref:Peptide/nickel transport system substrate-binding protein n=1 Tax=Paenibacillus phyllosphaerae TaxID=274593 RepID=A0A7W5FPW5_9BACL|nr:ABC transporter substrate-binding protein [Paenibacillus phyllosphaerae]MBB3112810.1 peptide/nickel transport system substrate-binding protein [Paenibacillus phyllosphaerae]
MTSIPFKFIPAAIVLATTVLLLSACSSATSNSAPSTAAESQPKDELILAVGGEAEDGFDPTTGWGRYGSPLFQSTLLKRDSSMAIVNDLATQYSISDDRLTWTVDLRDDVRFSDGEPLTAADVVYTFETAKSSNSVIDLTNLSAAKAVDDDTVALTLNQPQSTFVDILATLGIVPKHAHTSDYAEHPIGSGPYTLVQWDKGQQLIVERNANYYGEQPKFAKLTFLFLDEDAAFAAAKAGTVDVAYIPSAFSREEVAGMRLESLQSVDNRGIMFPYVPAGGTTKNGDPVGNDVTADLAIRQAINIGIDREALVEGILEGQGTPAYSVSDNTPWWNPDTVIADGDADKAKGILTGGGWKDEDGDGIVEKNGLKAQFTLIYPSGDVTRQSLAIASADMIKPLGIEVIVEGMSWDEIGKRMYATAVMFGWGSLDPLELYNVYASKYAGVDYYNPGYYSNAKVDAYMEQALAAASEDEANVYWKKAQWDGATGMSAAGDAPWAWLVNLNHLYLVNEKLDIGQQQIHPHGHGWPITSNIEQWTWTE